MMSLLLRTGIVSIWVGLMILLWRGGPGGPEDDPSTAVLPEVISQAINDEPGAGWMGLYMNGNKVGYASFRVEEREGGYRLHDRSLLRLRMMDQDQTVHALTTAEVDDSYALESFRVRLHSGVGEFKLHGRVQQERLEVDVDVGTQTDHHTFPLEGPVYLPSGLRARMIATGMRAGDRLERSIFDPAAMSAAKVVVEVVGREPLAAQGEHVDAWKIIESFRGVQTTVWLDEEGHTLREEGPMGLLAVRESASRAANHGWSDDALVDLMDAVAIAVTPGIEAPRQLARLEVVMDGLGPLLPPDDQRQSFTEGRLRVVREDTAARSTYALPYAGDAWREALASSRFVQSDHPKIVAATRAIVGDQNDARAAAIRLRRWVFDNLEKRAVASIPNALQVLEMGVGDCNEHAVLFAGLARAAGVPARVVAGIVYADGVFLYHAWNEVWLGEAWVSVDPAFDQMPVDATHIKLVVGEPDQHVSLIPVIGQLSIDHATTHEGGAESTGPGSPLGSDRSGGGQPQADRVAAFVGGVVEGAAEKLDEAPGDQQ